MDSRLDLLFTMSRFEAGNLTPSLKVCAALEGEGDAAGPSCGYAGSSVAETCRRRTRCQFRGGKPLGTARNAHPERQVRFYARSSFYASAAPIRGPLIRFRDVYSGPGTRYSDPGTYIPIPGLLIRFRDRLFLSWDR